MSVASVDRKVNGKLDIEVTEWCTEKRSKRIGRGWKIEKIDERTTREEQDCDRKPWKQRGRVGEKFKVQKKKQEKQPGWHRITDVHTGRHI